jgi:hypothetical protein
VENIYFIAISEVVIQEAKVHQSSKGYSSAESKYSGMTDASSSVIQEDGPYGRCLHVVEVQTYLMK